MNAIGFLSKNTYKFCNFDARIHAWMIQKNCVIAEVVQNYWTNWTADSKGIDDKKLPTNELEEILIRKNVTETSE